MTQAYALSELAERIGGDLHGDGKVTVTGVASIAVAGSNEITWIASAKHAPALSASKAGAVLVPREHGEAPMPAISCDSVDRALSIVLDLFASAVPRPSAGAHPTAIVCETATLGRDVAIGPYAVVEDGVSIGDRTVLYAGVHIGVESTIGSDCVLWNNVVVRERCTVGSRVILHPNVVIGSDGYGYFFAEGKHNKFPHVGRVVIADEVEIGSGSCVDRAKVGETYIGPGTKIDNLVQVAHNVRIGANCIIVAQCGIAGSTVLGDGVMLAGHVGVRDNIVLSDGVRVTACSCVSRSIPAGTTVGGNPAFERGQQLREQAVVRRLPDLVAQVRTLAKRVEELEAAADDQQNRRS